MGSFPMKYPAKMEWLEGPAEYIEVPLLHMCNLGVAAVLRGGPLCVVVHGLLACRSEVVRKVCTHFLGGNEPCK